MSDIKNINTKAEGDCGYVAGYMGKTIGVYAPTILTGREIAEKHFKVSKKNRGLFWITLAETRDGEVVKQSTAI